VKDGKLPQKGSDLAELSILGLLSIRPMHGYELRRSFQRALLPFVSLPATRVYPALNRLERAGDIKAETQVQYGLPNRKVYSLTPQGRERLLAWLQTSIALPVMQHEFLHKLFLLNVVAPEEAEERVREYAAAQQRRLEEFCDIREGLTRRLRSKDKLRDSVTFQLLSLDHLIRITEADLRGAEEVADWLKDRAQWVRRENVSAGS
jgi:DNA-binding PadR family transcriptional regulator